MRERPVIHISAAVTVLIVLVAFGVSAAGTDAPQVATEVPTSIPVNGVNINTQVVLLPAAPGDAPAIDQAQAINMASTHQDTALVPPTAILARVTVPGTIPPPDSPVPFDTIQDQLAWVVTYTFDEPHNAMIGGKASRPGESEPPPLWVTHYSAVLDADTGEFLIGFFTA
jgi:hypothetical protein